MASGNMSPFPMFCPLLSSSKQVLVSCGALLACAGSVKASSFPGDVLDFSESVVWKPLLKSNLAGKREARLRWDADLLEDDEDLMDLRIASTSTDLPGISNSNKPFIGRQSKNPFGLRMPQSFEDPLGSQHDEPRQRQPESAWTHQSVRDFENRLQERFGRNEKPQLLSTGTTIAGVCGYDGDGRPFVVLGADTRATAGRMVADKRCSKIHCLASNLWCCGAGTSADLDQITRHCRYSLALQSLMERESIGNAPRSWPPAGEEEEEDLESTAHHSASMAAACRFFRDILYKEGGNVGANLIVGGVDEGTGLPHIRAIHPHGSMDPLPYAALGSGGLAAMAVVESRYHRNITLQEGIQIVKEAILSGIQNDMGSGSQVDLCVITTTTEQGEGVRVVSNYTRAVVPEEELPQLEKNAFGSKSPQAGPGKGTSTPGVNGFGNYPFSIRSKRVVIESREAEDESRLKKWDTFLED